MSPGPTFERVYLALKRQLREGTRPPGTPLEPTAIGDELGTSFTPVRDALHRLVGEGLVDNPLHNGFSVPNPTEQALRDLYAWNGDLLTTMARAGAHIPIVPPEVGNSADPATEAAAALFLAIAGRSGNREHVRAIAQLNDRLAPYRRVEPKLFAGAADEVRSLVQAAQSAHPAALRQGLARYHRSRVAAAPQLLAALHA